MKKGRLEAFSDGVLAIIITIMVLEIEAPKGHQLQDLIELADTFVSYLVSFLFVGVCWVNHHHLFQIATKINWGILWGNLNFLFWLSLLPFATDWIGKSDVDEAPIMVYGVIVFIIGLAYKLLEYLVIKSEGKNSLTAKNLKRDKKWAILMTLNLITILVAFFQATFAMFLLVILAIAWIIPDKRLEKAYHNIKD